MSSTTTPDPVTAERNVNPRFWMDERTVDTLSRKLTVPLQLQLDSVSDGLKEEYRNLLGSLRDDLYSCAAGFALLNLPKGKSLGRSKPETNSYAQALTTHCVGFLLYPSSAELPYAK